MLYQIVIAVLLVILAVNLILNLRSLKRPNRNARIPEPAPLVSVLIPARNEEENIKTCLESLRRQDYPNFEILVLDDNSTDRTAEVVNRIAARDDRIQLIKGASLPEDWAGKPFACCQLAERARGSWLLFVDADTMHAPHMIRSVMALAIENKASLLSGFPHQMAQSLPEKIVMPLLYYFIIMSWIPLWWMHRSKKPRPSIAIGQLLLFPREAYARIGGHEAVSSKILEDVWLGVETVKHGGRHIAVDLSPVLRTRTYQNVGTMWEGIIKWMYSVAALSPLALLGLIAAGFFFYVAPFYWVLNGFLSSEAPADWRFIAVFQIAVILFMRWLVDSHFRHSFLSTFLHPLGFSFVLAASIYGAWRQAVGLGIRWKERLYGGETSRVK